MTAAPSQPASMDKIEMIERSMRAYWLGVAGVLPLLGAPFAILALRNNSQIKRRAGTQWNPAQPYLSRGLVCARVGLGLTIGILLFLAASLAIELTN